MQTSSKPQRSHLILIIVFDEGAFKYSLQILCVDSKKSEEVLSLLLLLLLLIEIFHTAQKQLILSKTQSTTVLIHI